MESNFRKSTISVLSFSLMISLKIAFLSSLLSMPILSSVFSFIRSKALPLISCWKDNCVSTAGGEKKRKNSPAQTIENTFCTRCSACRTIVAHDSLSKVTQAEHGSVAGKWARWASPWLAGNQNSLPAPAFVLILMGEYSDNRNVKQVPRRQT